MDQSEALHEQQALQNSQQEQVYQHAQMDQYQNAQQQQEQNEPGSPSSDLGDEDDEAKRLRVMHACLLCKKDHTACEAQRPCSRCIAKGVECMDAEHKKRGRKPKGSSQNGGVVYDDQPSPPTQPSGGNLPMGSLQGQGQQQQQQQTQMGNTGRQSSASFAPQQKRRKLNDGGTYVLF